MAVSQPRRTASDDDLVLPPGTPDWITPDLLQQTLTVWRPYYGTLTVEEAIEILLTAGQLMDTLENDHVETLRGAGPGVES